MSQTTKKKGALGRGLSALLDDSSVPSDPVKEDEIEKDGIYEIELNAIETNPFQPRTHFDEDALAELADSIRVQGIIQPVTVRLMGDGKFQLISGERRTQAARRVGLETIPAYVRTANDQQMLEMALIENIQRENLNAIEVALSYQRLMAECALKQEELGDRVGKKRTTINNYLRLLKLPPDIQAAIRDSKITMGHARAIINIDSLEKQLSIFERIIREGLSVRKVEELVRNSSEPKEKKQEPKKEKSGPLLEVQQKLVSHFGTKVEIKTGKSEEKGEIKIPYASTEDLNRILDLLQV